jgi:CheY-like chemotaxis protein
MAGSMLAGATMTARSYDTAGDLKPMPSERVLVVEDEPEIRDFVALLLGSEGYQVTTAANGAVALDRVSGETFDLVLLDMRMPVMDGWTFAHVYHERPGPHAPIVVLTAARDAAARAAQIQADGYLGKPFDMDDLLSLVAHHTGRA